MEFQKPDVRDFQILIAGLARSSKDNVCQEVTLLELVLMLLILVTSGVL